MNRNARVEAFAPATVANLGVGFDILGMAVTGAGDTIIAEYRQQQGAVILSISGDDGRLPIDPAENVATIAANAFLETLNLDHGVGLHLAKGLPLASGLGSSAASSVAAVMAVNALLGYPYQKRDLLPFTLEGEAAVSGYHADNVAPCLLGGITLNNGTHIDQITSLPVPDNLYLALVTPDVAVPTAEARAVLPEAVSLKTVVAQNGAVAALIDALHRSDLAAIAAAMESDQIVEPARAHLMPHMMTVREHAKTAGALAVVISGGGPTLCAICTSQTIAETVATKMASVYKEAGIAYQVRVCVPFVKGAHVVSVTQ